MAQKNYNDKLLETLFPATGDPVYLTVEQEKQVLFWINEGVALGQIRKDLTYVTQDSIDYVDSVSGWSFSIKNARCPYCFNALQGQMSQVKAMIRNGKTKTEIETEFPQTVLDIDVLIATTAVDPNITPISSQSTLLLGEGGKVY